MNRTTNWFQRRRQAGTATLALTHDSRKVTGGKRRKRAFSAHSLETLEDRQLLSGGATIYTVTDTHDSVTDTGSLRYAITQANTNANPAGSEIEFGSLFNTPQTINLASPLPALSDTTGTIAVNGPADGVTVQGTKTADTGALVTVNTNVNAALSNLTIAGGNNSGEGGGIINYGTLSLTASTLTGNSAGQYGGGVYNTSGGSLTVTGCTFTSNTSSYLGGAVRNDGSANILNSTFSNNTASYDGGGIDNRGTATVTGCTFDSNAATLNVGGGIDSGDSLSLIDCTLTGNSAGGSGGGLANFAGTATVTDCTISDNSAISDGGGIYNGGTATLTDTIVACNKAPTGPDVFGSFSSAGYNLIGVKDGSNGWITTDLTGSQASPLDPNLASLGDYGGPTQTMALLPDSPALKAGVAVPGVTTDQRGFIRGATIDIGAFQASGYLSDGLVVNTAVDWAGPGQLTFRQALNLANTWQGAETIIFDPTVFATPQTITLGSALPDLADRTGTETITGPAVGVTIARAAANPTQFGILAIDGDVTADLSNLTVTGGNDSGRGGGGILNFGTATLTDCTLSGNSATEKGAAGGILNYGTATFTNCTIGGNSAFAGGGICNGGTATFTNCTIGGNSAFEGGGICNSGTAVLTDCTISGNSAFEGGGLDNSLTQAPHVAALTDTIVAGNSAPNSPDIFGVYSGNNDLVGGNAMLAPLGNYGGPTQTMALMSGSPALGAGVAVSGVTTDQRGFSRGATVDIGAFQATGNDEPLVVNTWMDASGSGQLTLREAINLGAATDVTQSIVFDPTAFAIPRTLLLTSPLPVVPDGLSIDGRSVERIKGTPSVVLDGTVDSAVPDGLIVAGSLATIAGLEIANFPVGILVDSADAVGNVITQNVIVGDTVGLKLDQGASSNIIGGTGAGAGNVISGNGTGIVITDVGTTGNLVAGNLIGADETNPLSVGNTGDAIDIANGATGNEIGTSGAGNTIAFNQGAGVNVDGTSVGNLIRFNQIIGNTQPGIVDAAGAFPNAPVLSASIVPSVINGTLAGTPGQTNTVDFYASPLGDTPADPQGRDYLGSIRVLTDSGGNAAFSFTFTPIPGEPAITATAIDVNGSTSEFSAPVDSVLFATGVSITATVGIPFQGTVAQFAADPSATVADYTATINYGDNSGTFLGTVLAAPGRFIVTGSHTFTVANPAEPVTVTITDARGLDQATANSVASVTSPGGLLTPFAQSVGFVAGTTYSRVVAGFTDSNPQAFPGQFTASIAWGDGSANTAGTVSSDGAGFDVTGSHTYNFPGTSTVTEPVTVTITDTLTGAMITANSTATVAPVPITIQTKNFSVKGGTLFSGTVATFTDGDPRISPAFYVATINWGDGSPNSTGVITGANPFTVTSSHTFAPFQNIDLVTITITDQNGRTATAIDRVVDPPAVLDVQAAGLMLSPNKPFVETVATFTDSGPAEPASDYKATINWGKGRKAAGMITGSNGQFVVSAKHKFPRFSGAQTVTVTDITDGRTVSASESASYIVRQPKVSKTTRAVKIAEKSHR